MSTEIEVAELTRVRLNLKNALQNIYDMKTILSCPSFWLILFFLTGPGAEWLPPLRRFRSEQAKHPRFSDVPCSKTVDIILLTGWIVPLVSAVMICVGLTKTSDLGLLIFLGLIPIVICLMVITNKATAGNGIKTSWKSLALFGTTMMIIGSIGTTIITYMILCISIHHHAIKNFPECVSAIIELILVSTIALLGLFILTGIFLLIATKEFEDVPTEGALETDLKVMCLFNPVLSPLTIPLYLIFLVVRGACRVVRKLFAKIRRKNTISVSEIRG